MHKFGDLQQITENLGGKMKKIGRVSGPPDCQIIFKPRSHKKTTTAEFPSRRKSDGHIEAVRRLPLPIYCRPAYWLTSSHWFYRTPTLRVTVAGTSSLVMDPRGYGSDPLHCGHSSIVPQK